MKTIAIFLAGAAAIFAGFYYIGHLGVGASVLLSLLLADLTTGRLARSKQNPDFVPHLVRFNPHIGEMLLALNLMTLEQWKEVISRTPDEDPWSGDSLARRGLYGYALFQDSEGQTVIHWPKLHTYTNSYAIEIRLGFLEVDREAGPFSKWHPDFFVKPGTAGYAMGVEVKQVWWEANKDRLTSSGIVKNARSDYATGRTKLTLMTLPYEVILQFSASRSSFDSLRAKEAKALIPTGWTKSVPHLEIAHLTTESTYTSQYAIVSTSYLHG